MFIRKFASRLRVMLSRVIICKADRPRPSDVEDVSSVVSRLARIFSARSHFYSSFVHYLHIFSFLSSNSSTHSRLNPGIPSMQCNAKINNSLNQPSHYVSSVTQTRPDTQPVIATPYNIYPLSKMNFLRPLPPDLLRT